MTGDTTREPRANEQGMRLHPLTVLFGIGGELKNIAVPALVGLFAARKSDAPLMLQLGIVLAVALIVSLTRYFSFRLQYRESELVIRTGIIRKNERHIPYSRIQSVDSVRNAFHQLFGVAEVVIQTAGGDEPEAKLSVLRAEAVTELRLRIFGRAAQPGTAPPLNPALPRSEGSAELAGATAAPAPVQATAKTVLRLGPRELMQYGLIENRGMFLVLATIGLLFEFGPLQGILDQAVDRELGDAGPVRTFFASAFSRGGLPLEFLAMAAATLLVLLVLVRLISVVWATVRMHDFTVTKIGEDLRVEYGLFTRIAGTIPMGRVQTVSVRESLVHRLFGCATIQVTTAGGVGGSARNVAEPLMPIVPVGKVGALIDSLWPGLSPENVEWREVHPRAHLRIFRRSFVEALVYSAMLAFVLRWWALALLAALTIWNVATLQKRARSRKWGVTEHLFAARLGWLSRRMVVAWLSKVQVVSTGETYFDRRTGMSTLLVDTSGSSPVVQFLPVETARSVRDDLAAQAARSRFRL